MRKITHLKEKIAMTLGYLAIIALFYYLNIGCIFIRFFNTPCPGCGMTRALMAALRFDLAAAFSYHPMFWSMPILYAYFLLDNGLFASKKWNSILLWLIAIGFLVQWVLKIVE